MNPFDDNMIQGKRMLRSLKTGGVSIVKVLLIGLFCYGVPNGRLQAQCAKRLVSYYAYWDQWNNGTESSGHAYTSVNIPFSKITHIEHAFLYLDYTKNNGAISILAGYLEPNLITAAHAAGVKVLASVGGADANETAAFKTVSANAAYRTTFANNLKNFCTTYGYDGVDIDYEFPASAADKANLTLMMQAIRTAMPSPTYLISMATSDRGDQTWAGAYYVDFTTLKGVVDFFNVMTYDEHGDWSTNSGHNAAVSFCASDADGAWGLKESMNWYINTAGVPATQINAGMAFYGKEFKPVNNIWRTGAFSTSNVIDCVYGTWTKPRINLLGYTDHWDSCGGGSYLTGTDFVTYDSANA